MTDEHDEFKLYELCTIKLLGRTYRIKCPPGKREMLEASAELLIKRLSDTKETSGIIGTEDLLLMTLLNMCQQELEQKERQEQEALHAELANSQASAMLKASVKTTASTRPQRRAQASAKGGKGREPRGRR